jgi:hypothetical protein
MSLETQEAEFPYSVRIETARGQSADLPIVFLTRKQVEHFLQTDFNRLVQEAGVKGVRLRVERAITADYEQVLRDIAACLRTAKPKAA